jgi:hypothetical protein
MSDQDDSNPMHRIGHGRGDDYSPRKTSAYSFVQPPEKKVEPTQPMEAVAKALTVRDVITRLIEVDGAAWRGLPQSMKDALIERPQDFQFLPGSPKSGTTELVTVDILYNGVVLRYTYNGSWVVDRIVR